MQLDIVIPCFNEEAVLKEIYLRVNKTLEEVKKALLEEIVAFQKIDRQKIKKLRSEKYINMGSLSSI